MLQHLAGTHTNARLIRLAALPQGFDPKDVQSERTTADGTTIIKFHDGGAWAWAKGQLLPQ